MSGSGGFTVSQTRGADRLHNPQVRRQKRQLLQQQQLQRQKSQLSRQIREHTSVAVMAADTENRTDADDSAAALSKLPPPSCSSVPATVTNLDRVVESFTPFVPVHRVPEAYVRGRRTAEAELLPFYSLGDLWESYTEWSAYGLGVPMLLNGVDSVMQYYVPSLSGIQLYVDHEKSNSRLRTNVDCEAYRQNVVNSLPSRETDICSSPGTLLYQYLEVDSPYNRRPLTDMMSVLASQFPDLNKRRSCDLSPASWICVAWYPIYRIPLGSSRKNLDAAFLTFHKLATHSRSFGPTKRYHQKGGPEKTTISRISLPVFGLATYKYKGSIASTPHECKKETLLLEAADKWLRSLKVFLQDYDHFQKQKNQVQK